MSGIPERQAKLQLVKALLARGANPNTPMTQRPPGFAGGHTDVIGATPFLLASAAADMEMMRLLLAAGADPKVPTKSNMTAIAAATGVNRVQGESNVTEAQAFEVVKFLIELGVDPKAAVSTGENAIFGAAYRGWNSVVQLLADHGTDVNAISKSGTTPWRAASGQGDRLGGVLFNHGYRGAARQARRGSDTRQAVYGADEVSVMVQKALAVLGAGCLVLGVWSPVHGSRAAPGSPEPSGLTPEPVRRTRPAAFAGARARDHVLRLVPQPEIESGQLRPRSRGCRQHRRTRRRRGRKWWSKLRSRAMPPPRSRRPDNKTYDAVVGMARDRARSRAAANPNPGRPADLHRLNRAEYANAVRDLLGVQVDGTLILPPDEQAHGFDTNADALSVVPALLDRYLTAAAKISRLAVGDPTLRPAFERYTAVRNNSNERTWLWQTDRLGEEFPLGSRGGIAARHYFPVDGEYVLKARLDKTYTGMVRGLNVPNEIEFRVDGKRVGQFTLGGPEFSAAAARAASPDYADAGNPLFTADDGLEVRVPLKAGLHEVTVTAVKADGVEARRSGARSHPDLGPRLRRRHPRAARFFGAAHRRAVQRPDAAGIAQPPPHLRVLSDGSREETPCATKILSTLASARTAGQRRKKTCRRCSASTRNGRAKADFEAGIRSALERLLVSPDFLFRIEADPAGVKPGAAYRISGRRAGVAPVVLPVEQHSRR